MIIQRLTLCIALTTLFALNSFGQLSVRDSSVAFGAIEFRVGYFIPGAEMHQRFGGHFGIGTGYRYKFASNVSVGISGQFLFGDQVKENGILSGIATDDGFLISQTGQPAVVNLFMRGFRGQVSVGKIFPWFGPNENSGLDVRLGVGVLSHKIRIQDEHNNTPQVLEEYAKGYDRLTSGMMLNQYIGYNHTGNNQRINFSLGFVFSEAFTKNRRTWNFDVNAPLDQSRFDSQVGVQLIWYIPIYKRAPREFYYD